MEPMRALGLGCLIALCGFAQARAAGSPARAAFHHTYPLPANGLLSVESAAGTIRIVGWDRNSVQVDATECAPTSADLNNLKIDVTTEPDAVRVKTTFPDMTDDGFSWDWLFGQSTTCEREAVVEYIIHAPDRARVSLTSASADFDVTGPIGSLDTSTSSGDLNAASLGDVTASSHSGDMKLSHIRGRARVQTTSGDVSLADASGDFEVSTTSGEVGLDRTEGKVHVTTTSGDINAHAFGGLAQLRSTSGDVSLTLVRGQGVALQASTTNGDIQSDVPLRSVAPVSVRTVSGDIVASFL